MDVASTRHACLECMFCLGKGRALVRSYRSRAHIYPGPECPRDVGTTVSDVFEIVHFTVISMDKELHIGLSFLRKHSEFRFQAPAFDRNIILYCTYTVFYLAVTLLSRKHTSCYPGSRLPAFRVSYVTLRYGTISRVYGILLGDCIVDKNNRHHVLLSQSISFN